MAPFTIENLQQKKAQNSSKYLKILKIVVPYEAGTQKVKNVAQTVFKGHSDAIFIISLQSTQPEQFRFKQFHLREILVYQAKNDIE